MENPNQRLHWDMHLDVVAASKYANLQNVGVVLSEVLGERRWKEVTTIFSFPPSATNASFILRKYYISLLHHYEQIYFFKAKGWTPLHTGGCLAECVYRISSTSWVGWTRAAITRNSSICGTAKEDTYSRFIAQSSSCYCATDKLENICCATHLEHSSLDTFNASLYLLCLSAAFSHECSNIFLWIVYPPYVPGVQVMAKINHKSNLTLALMVAATPEPSSGSAVMGVIDGKFESGYLITVTIGSEKLKGVLYQTPQNPDHQVPQHRRVPQNQNVCANNSDNSTPVSGVLRRKRRKKSEIKRRDPAHPKPNRSGYNFFFAEQHARLKPLYPGKDREISRMIGDLWNKIKEPEKAVYQEKAGRDKERYRLQMEDYRKRLRMGLIISDAVPIQQRPMEPDVNMMELDEKTETEGADSPHTPGNEVNSGKSDNSNLEGGRTNNRTADEDSDMGISLGAEARAESLSTKILADEEAYELRDRIDNVGDEGKKCLGNIASEIAKQSSSSEEKESGPIEEKESVSSEETTNTKQRE
ncbi:unnamed protein product [Ilex paraguariensis]|uniref:Uncharacterized protein n=1 Tax=Ilex paraguariensis TaxID=185542 RepID=A0ABC8T7Z9_9AQUA